MLSGEDLVDTMDPVFRHRANEPVTRTIVWKLDT